MSFVLLLVFEVTIKFFIGILDEDCEHDKGKGKKSGGSAIGDGYGGDDL